MSAPRILYCHCAQAQVVPREVKEAVLRHLCESGVPFDSVADLCELSARRDPILKQIADSGAVTIAACYPRAVHWLFAAAGANLPSTTEVLNMRVESAETVFAALKLDNRKAGAGPILANEFPTVLARLGLNESAAGRWTPWFPVIDYDRCTHCMQCLSFCLFGVYGVDSKSRIQAQNPEQCKTNCPACSRVCPEGAIIFPKHKTGPINGDAVTEADLNREAMKVDISALLGGDVYSLLRNRGDRAKSRFSKERDPDLALKERQRCLAALAQSSEIPEEVLMSLPSAEEIARRAAEAMRRRQGAEEARRGGEDTETRRRGDAEIGGASA
ncbi:MAG: hypothetical protein WCP06_11410 [Verrucomicrobiota bacterium]